MYFIAVDAHGKWTDQQLLQTIADNWPSVLDQYLATGDTAAPLSDDEVKSYVVPA